MCAANLGLPSRASSPFGCLLFAVYFFPLDLSEMTLSGRKKRQTCPEMSSQAADSRTSRRERRLCVSVRQLIQLSVTLTDSSFTSLCL